MLNAFAPQLDYTPRMVFLYPHNYTVMRDVINEDAAEGVSANMHFYVTPRPFFKSIHKAIRVTQALLQEGSTAAPHDGREGG
ncbi:hypothetical protein STCU_11953 [Strigomonas culicis]|uniref:Uncharacterized protein n=1 Tax=Strigomonas culicis TaxID=28005 RepID=S9TF15_9TRYP|nr:hypothetical protein STCU_11953 [Strigomonas culicis]|eukprot:EPY15524.1 hypothetical protein STCU_11953 [Strigomonas culicis]